MDRPPLHKQGYTRGGVAVLPLPEPMDGRAILGRSRGQRPDRGAGRLARPYGRADRDHRGPKPRVAGLQYDRRRQRAAPARSPAVAGRGGRVSAEIARPADTAAQYRPLNPKPLIIPTPDGKRSGRWPSYGPEISWDSVYRRDSGRNCRILGSSPRPGLDLNCS